nr:hypothetical protein [Tanacetum cinerariifolium]
MQNLEDISNLTTALDMALKLMAKAFQLNNSTPTNNNQRSSSNPCNSQIAQSGMNMDQDRQMLMVDDNVGNQFRKNSVQNEGNLVGQNAVQNEARAEGNGNGINGNPIRCYNYQEVDHYARNYTVKPRKQDAAYLQKQFQIAQKEEAGIPLTFEEFDFMATIDRSAEVHLSENCHENDIFNMFTQEEHVEQGGRTVEQQSITVEEIHTYHESLFHNLVAEVKKVNSVNHKMKETNADLTTEFARYKNQEKCFEISQEKYDKLERAQLFDKVSEQNDTTKGTSVNTQFCKQSILGKPPSSSRPKLYAVTPLPKSKAIPKVGESNALSKTVASNSVPSSHE